MPFAVKNHFGVIIAENGVTGVTDPKIDTNLLKNNGKTVTPTGVTKTGWGNTGVTSETRRKQGFEDVCYPVTPVTPKNNNTLNEEIVTLFHERAGICEYDGGLPKNRAEGIAWNEAIIRRLSEQGIKQETLSCHDVAAAIRYLLSLGLPKNACLGGGF